MGFYVNKLPAVALASITAALALGALAACNDSDDEPTQTPATVVSVSPSVSVKPSKSVEVSPSVSVKPSVSISVKPLNDKRNDVPGDGGV